MTSETFEIGLNEAGYGPLLGPLAIGAVRVRGPMLALKRAAASRRKGFPRILDSKVLYRGGAGIADVRAPAPGPDGSDPWSPPRSRLMRALRGSVSSVNVAHRAHRRPGRPG